jgi:hypothetical protein
MFFLYIICTIPYLIFSKSRGCIQNNLVENPRNTYRVDLFTSQHFPWIHYSIHGIGEDFSKRVDSICKKTRVDPTLFAQLVHNFSNTYTGGFTKRIRNLNSAFEKAASQQIFHCRREIWIQKESTHKKSVYLPPILKSCVYESG